MSRVQPPELRQTIAKCDEQFLGRLELRAVGTFEKLLNTLCGILQVADLLLKPGDSFFGIPDVFRVLEEKRSNLGRHVDNCEDARGYAQPIHGC